MYSHRTVFWGPEMYLGEEYNTNSYKKGIRTQNHKDTVNTEEAYCQYFTIPLY